MVRARRRGACTLMERGPSIHIYRRRENHRRGESERAIDQYIDRCPRPCIRATCLVQGWLITFNTLDYVFAPYTRSTMLYASLGLRARYKRSLSSLLSRFVAVWLILYRLIRTFFFPLSHPPFKRAVKHAFTRLRNLATQNGKMRSIRFFIFNFTLFFINQSRVINYTVSPRTVYFFCNLNDHTHTRTHTHRVKKSAYIFATIRVYVGKIKLIHLFFYREKKENTS